ncbi:hypothetical protein B0T14DRAFT_550121 [Immersiella caudata]|uniref:Uncharacterized protein n=1 Tax=Immersiella caudata TaxID=314043 RepID=A0AA39XG10_9PEZI|nr:hypothetical protein B0T14DRAFT_550121 [Immersiella caudata]
MEIIKTLLFSLLAVTAAALPSASGSDHHARSILAPRDNCAAAGPGCTGVKWDPDCPGGHCVPFQGPHIGFWCCPHPPPYRPGAVFGVIVIHRVTVCVAAVLTLVVVVVVVNGSSEVVLVVTRKSISAQVARLVPVSR